MKIAMLVPIALIAACTRTEPAHPVEAAPAHQAAQQASTKSDARAAAAPINTAPLPVSLVVEQNADGVGVRVVVRGNEPLELAQAVSARLASGGESTKQALTLRLDCAQTGCAKLTPGAELTAPRTLGLVEHEACTDAAAAALDRRFVPSAAGEYVLTVRSCDGARSAEARFRWTPP